MPCSVGRDVQILLGWLTVLHAQKCPQNHWENTAFLRLDAFTTMAKFLEAKLLAFLVSADQ